jgi:hypothetical protein
MGIGYWLVIIGFMDINYVIIGYGYRLLAIGCG